MLVEGFGTTPHLVVGLVYVLVFSLTAYWLRSPF